jgi:glutathione peroxidase
MTELSSISLKTINGTDSSLGEYAGKVILIVNVASKCGLTPQYEGLEKLYQAKKNDGLVILGFPANDFGAQEPGSDDEIAEFCSLNYGVSFPMFAKGDVTGPGKQPLYTSLTAAVPTKQGDVEGMKERFRGHGMIPNDDPEVLWNFEKFVIGRDGEVAARFAPAVAPDDSALVAVIEAELAK